MKLKKNYFYLVIKSLSDFPSLLNTWRIKYLFIFYKSWSSVNTILSLWLDIGLLWLDVGLLGKRGSISSWLRIGGNVLLSVWLSVTGCWESICCGLCCYVLSLRDNLRLCYNLGLGYIGCLWCNVLRLGVSHGGWSDVTGCRSVSWLNNSGTVCVGLLSVGLWEISLCVHFYLWN